ncbi:YwaF family protein [Lachnospiraceae bacterium MD308]|nr:YwaF family protein [Lachnospiraceae bacterium MD308]MCI8580337.1 YwaF family protein [Dorea sp.]
MKKNIRFLFVCGIVMLLSEIWKQYCITFIINKHFYNWWHFPFQLCSIPMYLCLLLPFVSEKIREVFLTFLMTFSLMGGIFTFFDTSGLHHSYAPLTVHSYLWHILLIIIGITAGLCQRKKNTAGIFSGSVICYLICCIIATLFNIIFHSYGTINMFYISPYYKMGQKVFKDIASLTGNTAGILIYIGTNIVGAYLIYLIWLNSGRYIKLFRNFP